MNKKYPCPCCGNKTLNEKEVYEICTICNWEDDPLQKSKPNYSGGANKVSLNQAKKNFKKYGKSDTNE